MRLHGRLVSVAEVTAEERERMFSLMDRHYEQIAWANFAADLAEKDWVIQVHHPQTGELCGFSTQMLLEVEVEGLPIKALFSGDTIIDREHWGDAALARIWGRLALSLMDEYPAVDLYWFLISKGYKTYRFLPVFFREYFPRPERATPEWAQTVIDALALHKYPESYNASAGVIRGAQTKDRLRHGVADITAQRLKDPHVRFFVERNPGFAEGNELCCLARLTRENFTTAAYRVIGSEPVLLGAS